MTRPPTMAQAADRDLIAKKGQDIHTFSNGSAWESWASGNCHRCRFFDPDAAGALCAFECAAFLHLASPELATMFGWTQNPEYATYQGKEDAAPGRHGWKPPKQCSFFLDAKDDDGEDRPLPPEPDPTQLILIADPTEDIATFPAPAPKSAVPELVPV